MEELQYYSISDDYCSACLNSSAVVPLLPNTAKVFFSTIEASVLTPWLCNQCSDTLHAYEKHTQRPAPEILKAYKQLTSRARRAQTLLSNILFNSQIVQTKIDYYIAELNKIKGNRTKETMILNDEPEVLSDSSSDLYAEKPKSKPRIHRTSQNVVFDESDNMYYMLSNVLRDKVIKIKISEPEYLEWVKEQLQTESYRTAKFKCENCALGFPHRYLFREHMKLHCSAAGRFCCPLCEQYLDSDFTLGVHMKSHLSRFSCVECGLHSNDRTVLADHYFSEHSAILFHCKRCGTVARTPSDLKQHMNTHQYECDHCHKIFLNKHELRVHIVQRHLKITNFQCSKCEKMFITKPQRRLHFLRIHCKVRPDKDKICDICGKAFQTNRDLSRHGLIHTGERPHQCQECGLRFRQKGVLVIHHQTIHMGITYREIVINRRKRHADHRKKHRTEN